MTVQLDGKELWKVKKAEMKQTIEQVSAGNHVVFIYGADENDRVGETSLNVDKNSRTEIKIDNNSVHVISG